MILYSCLKNKTNWIHSKNINEICKLSHVKWADYFVSPPRKDSIIFGGSYLYKGVTTLNPLASCML